MVDTCTIRHQTGVTVNPDTGASEPTYTVVYTGKCRVQSRNLGTESPNAGQQRVDIYATELQLPISVTGVAVNDLVEITDSLDPDLIGRTLRVNNLFYKTHATSRRLPLEEVVS